MFNAKKIEDIAKQITDAIPPSVKSAATGFEEKTKQLLQRKFAELDFVTREEFDVQTQVLLKTRLKLEALEEKILALEAQQNNKETS